MEGLGGTRPLDLDPAILRKAVSQVEIDEALVGYARLHGHAFEVLNHVLGEAHGDRLLKLRRVRVWTRLHLRQIVFSLHVIHPGSFVLQSRSLCERK